MRTSSEVDENKEDFRVNAYHMGPFTNDVRREGEGGGCPSSDAVREVA